MKREIHIDLLGLGHLLKGVQYLLFPAAAGIELFSTILEAEVEAQAAEAQARERPPRKHHGNTRPEG